MLTGAARFEALLGKIETPRALHDTPIFQFADLVVAPTLGAILPNWFLVLPITNFINYSQAYRNGFPRPSKIIDKICTELKITPFKVIWFEHGAASAGTQVGCGVDHAHLHILIDPPFDLSTFSREVLGVYPATWTDCRPDDSYGLVSEGVSYLVYGSFKEAKITQGVDSVGSQFFRRAIARLSGAADSWNYRTHPFYENIVRTVTFAHRAAELPQIPAYDNYARTHR